MAKRDFCFWKRKFYTDRYCGCGYRDRFYADEWRGRAGPGWFQSGYFQCPPYCCGSGCDGDRLRVDDCRYFEEQQK